MAGKKESVQTATGARVAAEEALRACLELADGTVYRGRCFGAARCAAGEVVFNTGMVGYPQTLTDPSYRGQILVCTYPLIGNYGVPPAEPDVVPCRHFESGRVQVEGLIVGDYSSQFSHWEASRSLGDWLTEAGLPALTGIDTRALTQRLREHGTMPGVIRIGDETIPLGDSDRENLIQEVSIPARRLHAPAGKPRARVGLLDCGMKHSLLRSLLARDLEVLCAPWDDDLHDERLDGLVISNGPGDPRTATCTVEHLRKLLDRGLPTLGVCLGHQLMALAAGAETFKLPYGHRGQNQPVIECGTTRCMITSQNHGYAVDPESLPRDWRPWFTNLNDGTNEGLRHARAPFRSVQFHPEARPGPGDAAILLDDFCGMIGP